MAARWWWHNRARLRRRCCRCTSRPPTTPPLCASCTSTASTRCRTTGTAATPLRTPCLCAAPPPPACAPSSARTCGSRRAAAVAVAMAAYHSLAQSRQAAAVMRSVAALLRHPTRWRQLRRTPPQPQPPLLPQPRRTSRHRQVHARRRLLLGQLPVAATVARQHWSSGRLRRQGWRLASPPPLPRRRWVLSLAVCNPCRRRACRGGLAVGQAASASGRQAPALVRA